MYDSSPLYFNVVSTKCAILAANKTILLEKHLRREHLIPASILIFSNYFVSTHKHQTPLLHLQEHPLACFYRQTFTLSNGHPAESCTTFQSPTQATPSVAFLQGCWAPLAAQTRLLVFHGCSRHPRHRTDCGRWHGPAGEDQWCVHSACHSRKQDWLA